MVNEFLPLSKERYLIGGDLFSLIKCNIYVLKYSTITIIGAIILLYSVQFAPYFYFAIFIPAFFYYRIITFN